MITASMWWKYSGLLSVVGPSTGDLINSWLRRSRKLIKILNLWSFRVPLVVLCQTKSCPIFEVKPSTGTCSVKIRRKRSQLLVTTKNTHVRVHARLSSYFYESAVDLEIDMIMDKDTYSFGSIKPGSKTVQPKYFGTKRQGLMIIALRPKLFNEITGIPHTGRFCEGWTWSIKSYSRAMRVQKGTIYFMVILRRASNDRHV